MRPPVAVVDGAMTVHANCVRPETKIRAGVGKGLVLDLRYAIHVLLEVDVLAGDAIIAVLAPLHAIHIVIEGVVLVGAALEAVLALLRAINDVLNAHALSPVPLHGARAPRSAQGVQQSPRISIHRARRMNAVVQGSELSARPYAKTR